jgi:hypothetical protein
MSFVRVSTGALLNFADAKCANGFVDPEFLRNHIQVGSPCEGLEILGVGAFSFHTVNRIEKVPDCAAQREASTVNATVHVRSSFGSFIGA